MNTIPKNALDMSGGELVMGPQLSNLHVGLVQAHGPRQSTQQGVQGGPCGKHVPSHAAGIQADRLACLR